MTEPNAPVVDDVWEGAKKQMIQDEEERIDLHVALARAKQKEFYACSEAYRKNPVQGKMEECSEVWISSFFSYEHLPPEVPPMKFNFFF